MQLLKRVPRLRPESGAAAGGAQAVRPRRRIPRWWPLLVGALAVCAVVAGVLWLRGRGNQSANGLQVYVVARGNLEATVAATGEVYAPRQADLGFDVSRIPLTELDVAPGQQVKAGDVLARIDPTSLQRAVTQAEADLTVAQDNLDKAKNPYTDLDLTKAKLAVEDAQMALADAQDGLDAVQHPDLDAAQAAVDDAAATLKSAQNQMTIVQNDTSNAAEIRTLEYEAKWYENNYASAQVKFQNGEIDQQKLDFEYSNMLAAEEKLTVAKAKADSAITNAQNQLDKAQQAYQDAQGNLAALQNGPDPTELAKAQHQVDQAQYNLDTAQASLDAVEAGPVAKDVEAAQAKADGAQAALDAAKAALAAATMTAPFDGTVISVGAAIGDLVSSGTVVVSLADLSNLQVEATVDETDIANVQIGQDATITFDALPGSRFQGKVLEVPLQGTLTQNILTYAVPVNMGAADTGSLKPGMTANVTIVVGQPQNVLLVPALAVQQGESGSVVMLQESPGGTPVEAPVQLGLSDGIYVEVKKGLNEGDRVVFQYDTSQQQQGYGAFGDMRSMGPGGGFISNGGRGVGR